MKSITPFFILFFAFFGVLYAQDKPANPEALQLFIEGKTLELQDNYIAAISKYNDALKIEKAPGIYYTLSKLYYNVSQYPKALETGLTALKLSPSSPDYLENVADDYIILNDFSNAILYLKQVAEKKPDDINILYNIGRIYEAQKQPSEAIKYYEKISNDFQYDETVLLRMIDIYENYKDYANEAATIEKLLVLNPTDIQIKYTAAAAYEKIPDYNNALKIYEQILQTNPINREVQTEIIKIYFRDHRINEAFEKYGKLIDKDTIDFNTKIEMAIAFLDASANDPEALGASKSILQTLQTSYPAEWMPEFYLGMIDAKENNTGMAEQKFKDVLTKADTSIEARVQIGFFYYDLNRLPEALDIFTTGLQRFPDDFRLNFFTGNTHYRMGKSRDALPYLVKAESINAADINLLSTLGIIYDNLNMDAECDNLYAQAFKYFPDNILLLNNYAYHLSERGTHLKEALEMSKKTIDAQPNSSSYLDTYGWICFKLKDYNNAEKYILKAISIGKNATLVQHLGDVYEGKGEIVKALKAWKEAIELSPDNKDLIYKIEKYK